MDDVVRTDDIDAALSAVAEVKATLTTLRAENERLREELRTARNDERALIVADLKRLASEHPTLATVLIGFADRYERKLDRAALKGEGR